MRIVLAALGNFLCVSTTSASESALPSSGGSLDIHWNHLQLEAIGVTVSTPLHVQTELPTGFDRFALAPAIAPTVIVHGQAAQRLSAEKSSVVGGYNLVFRAGSIDLTDFTLRMRSSSPVTIDIVTKLGEIPLYADHVMAETRANGERAISAMDLRVSPDFAARLGVPEASKLLIGTMRIWSTSEKASHTEACPSSGRWPGMAVPDAPGRKYEADMFLEGLVVEPTGCRNCSGPKGKGDLKLTPTTILRSNVNDGQSSPTIANDPRGTSAALYSADIPWRAKFSANCPPYNNDQHPYLIWNLYRINAEGQLEQLARSGMKHGHVAENTDCHSPPHSNHVFGRGCVDVYGAGDNDAPDALGPRAEVIPFTGQWGRCGSIYDPHCKARESDFQAYDDFTYRLTVPEALIGASEHAGDRYFIEAWYVVRDDIDVYNTMAHRQVSFRWNPTNALWRENGYGPVRLGPVIDEWAHPSDTSIHTRDEEAVTQQGRVKVAVHVTPLERGFFRYDYAVMNFDLANVKTSGVEPNLRILESHGLTRFELPLPAGALIVKDITFTDTDRDMANDWVATRRPKNLTWNAPTGNELTWGTLYRFSFTTNRSPQQGAAKLTIEGSQVVVNVATEIPATEMKN